MDLRLALEIAQRYTPERMEHIYGTVDKATHLAERFSVDLYKCQIAAALHDLAKNIPRSKQEAILQSYKPDYLSYSPNVYHGPVARYLLEREFDITDRSILNAVEYHVTGHPEMDEVLKVLYISDYIERGRTHHPVHFCRYLSTIDLDLAVLGVSDFKLSYLRAKQADNIHPLTIQTHQSFLEKVGEAVYESIKDHYQRHFGR